MPYRFHGAMFLIPILSRNSQHRTRMTLRSRTFCNRILSRRPMTIFNKSVCQCPRKCWLATSRLDCHRCVRMPRPVTSLLRPRRLEHLIFPWPTRTMGSLILTRYRGLSLLLICILPTSSRRGSNWFAWYAEINMAWKGCARTGLLKRNGIIFFSMRSTRSRFYLLFLHGDNE